MVRTESNDTRCTFSSLRARPLPAHTVLPRGGSFALVFGGPSFGRVGVLLRQGELFGHGESFFRYIDALRSRCTGCGFEEVPDQIEGVVGALSPELGAEGDATVVEAYPCSGDEVRVHHDEPAVGGVLGGSGFGGQVV